MASSVCCERREVTYRVEPSWGTCCGMLVSARVCDGRAGRRSFGSDVDVWPYRMRTGRIVKLLITIAVLWLVAIVVICLFFKGASRL